MTARAWLLGAGIAVAFPALVHLLLAAASRMLSTNDTGDFAYHDTTFVVYHIGWAGSIALGLVAFILYTLMFVRLRPKK
ncbi:hypothetical protein [Cohnella rhizosphaerae]|uniref:Uncharacterized protein n=1 Tax=Cohnella rhizosphaerae TaxID=1457232 RepID=A0A9X4KQ17_9BACL|nr:hypothetical protein [Cohnella rhizosphaerae]MDG0809014.1 hypothetical protein [Cohnella rhizosphaerae]